MTQIDEAINLYYTLQPTNFHDLERLEVRQGTCNGVWEITIEIELRAKNASSSQRLVLIFGGVSNLKYNPASLSVLKFSFIEIISVKEKQWEGINYQVFESEQDTDFSLLCRDFNVKLREASS